MRQLPKTNLARRSLAKNGAVLVARNLATAARFVNRFAPGAPEPCPAATNGLLDRIDSAGSVFLGDWSAQTFGDYASGTNHVLPTGGVARTRGGLSVTDFVKCISVQEVSRAGVQRLAPVAEEFARAEGLDAHGAFGRGAQMKARANDPGAARGRADAPVPSAARRPHRKTAPRFQRESDRLLARRASRAREVSAAATISAYPEQETVRRKAARHFGVRPDELLLTNGTDEALQPRSSTPSSNRATRVLLVEPTYAMYRFYSELAGARIVAPRYDAAMQFPWKEVLAALRAGAARLLSSESEQPDRQSAFACRDFGAF